MTTPRHQHETWDERLHEGTGPVQDAFLELVRRTQNSLHYCDNMVWGNLQTREYARAVLQQVVAFHAIPDDVEAGVARRTARAQFMGREGRTYHALLGEQALRTNLGGVEVMRGQLRHLLEALELPGLRLRIIPSRAELALFPGHAFSIFDDRQVKIETYSAGLNITDEAEVAAYRKAFAWLARSAVYGEEARRVIEEELRAIS
ncbi:DUF5753 domain-containing protein [Streptomyces acidicola]|uniref:DUF5753 domain-containing protein n=1 Tax=Streptomyces acidicola TaxID=2596892 RepID=UPI0037A7DC5B